jgi:hypothetical protein
VQLLACVLTLAASGDDVNLLRAVLPAPFASIPVGALPLDDENTDFIETENSVAPDGTPARPDGRLACLAGWTPGPAGCRSATPPFPLQTASRASEHSARAHILTPLRC